MSLAFFHLDTVFPSVSIPVINSDPNFVRLTYVDQQRAQAFPKKSSLKLLVVFVFCREILESYSINSSVMGQLIKFWCESVSVLENDERLKYYPGLKWPLMLK